WLIYWLLFKTTWGFDLRAVGANPRAARYAGMNISKNTMLAMSISGALAGLAGANQILAVNHSMAIGLSAGYGYDSIALALLGNSQPLGVVLAALLFGTLRNGATKMMVVTGIPIDIISILQALIVMFVAAPAIIRSIYRLKATKAGEGVTFSVGWGGNKK
ncbi:MAG: ABC transporter permease, partial [Anaerolineaceae bacterium]